MLHATLGEYEKSIQSYRFVLKLDPKHKQTHADLCRIYVTLKKFSAACLVGEARQIHPGDSVVLIPYLDALAKLKKFDEAESIAKVLLKNQDKDAETLYHIGLFRLDQRRYKDSVEFFRKSLVIDKNYLPSSYLLAMILSCCPEAEVRDGKKALELAKGLEKQSKSPKSKASVTFLLARVRAELGDFDGANSAIAELRKMPGVSAEILENLEDMRQLFENRQPYRFRDVEVLHFRVLPMQK